MRRGIGRRRRAPSMLFDAKADALALLAALGAPVENLQTTTDAPAWFHPGRSGVLRLGATVLAQLRRAASRACCAALDVKGPAVAFETDIDRIPQPRAKTGAGPAAAEGLALPAHRARLRLRRRGGHAGGEAGPRRQERGQGADHQRLGLRPVRGRQPWARAASRSPLSVVLQPTERTLTEAEIEAVAAKIVAAVNKATGGTLRG